MTNNNELSIRSKRWQGAVLLLILIAIILPRALDLDQYATTDETLWLHRSANFYYALGQRDFKQTYQDKHPGVSIMWAGAAGFLVNYPEYRSMGQGYFSPLNFHYYLDEKEKEPLELLVAGRTFLVIGTAVFFIAAFLMTVKLIGKLPATLGFLFIAFDPFLIALNTILHPDNLLPSLMLLSSVGFMMYLEKGHDLRFLILSAAAAAGSWLTKVSGLFLLPYVGLLTLIDLLGKKMTTLVVIKKIIRPLVLWTLISIILFVVLWPAMWVSPLNTISNIINSLSFQYRNKTISNPVLFNGQLLKMNELNLSFYPFHYVWRSTPIVLIGLGLTLLGMIAGWGLLNDSKNRKFTITLFLFPVFYILTLSQAGLKANRYLGAIFPILDLVAAIGWLAIIDKIKILINNRFNFNYSKFMNILLVGVIMIFQILIVWQVRPYYWSYYNPFLGGPNIAPEIIDVGYGEGLDQAGRYLETKPNANELTVLSWYGVGPFSYFYSGPFNFTAIIPGWTKTNARRLAEADFIVIYVNQSQRQLTRPLLDVLTSVEPEHIIVINNIEYAWIYDVRDIPQEDFEYLTSFE